MYKSCDDIKLFATLFKICCQVSDRTKKAYKDVRSKLELKRDKDYSIIDKGNSHYMLKDGDRSSTVPTPITAHLRPSRVSYVCICFICLTVNVFCLSLTLFCVFNLLNYQRVALFSLNERTHSTHISESLVLLLRNFRNSTFLRL